MSDLKDRVRETIQQSPTMEELTWVLASMAKEVPAKKRASIMASVERRADRLETQMASAENVTPLGVARMARATGLSIEDAAEEMRHNIETRVATCRWLIGRAF